ncbi:hypothetical protein IFT73_13560 [Aeromicrobium sp. CFBP 8757]|uniref:hypothetical protein n=1 Tax=Aeromicrobium sp. CFBP 8757 TaxID=2775288 RepID=UPI00177BC4FC|nr:hypothetical protein [Aeromicrobium sp. CFBP 8757]MBD8607884.1 hypothetical protein [Aeromicrobium sp. CFBP 8757]
MLRQTLACGIGAAIVATGAACDANSESDAGAGSCDGADSTVVQQIMAGARTDFRPTLADGSPGVLIKRLEPLDASVAKLPEKDREFGADQLVALQVSVVLGGEDTSGGIGGFDGPVYFALDAEGKLLGPVGQFTASQFDLESPADADWLSWGDKVESTELGFGLADCVKPS